MSGSQAHTHSLHCEYAVYLASLSERQLRVLWRYFLANDPDQIQALMLLRRWGYRPDYEFWQ